MIYLASPYSDPDPTVEARRFDDVCAAASDLMRKRFHVFSPIAHCHPIALRGRLPTDYAYWSEYNREMLTACDEFWILTLPGWQESVGLKGETAIALQLGKPFRTCVWRNGHAHLGPLHPVSDAIPR